MTEAAKQVYETFIKNNKKKQTSWWTDEIKALVKKKKEKWKKYLREGENYDKYKAERKNVKLKIQESKRQAQTIKNKGDLLTEDHQLCENRKNILKNF